MERIEVALRAQEGDEDAEEFVGDGAEDGAGAFAGGFEAGGEGAQQKVVAFGDEGGHVQGVTQVSVAFAGEPGGPLGEAGLPSVGSQSGPGGQRSRV